MYWVKLWKTEFQRFKGQPELIVFYCWLTTKATFKNTTAHIKNFDVDLVPGDVIYGRIKASEELGLSETKLNTCIRKLVELDVISVNTFYKQFSVIHINDFCEKQTVSETVSRNVSQSVSRSVSQTVSQNSTQPQGFEGNRQARSVSQNVSETNARNVSETEHVSRRLEDRADAENEKEKTPSPSASAYRLSELPYLAGNVGTREIVVEDFDEGMDAEVLEMEYFEELKQRKK